MPTLHADYSQLSLYGLRVHLEGASAPAGLVTEFEPGHPVIWTGIHEGPVTVRFQQANCDPGLALDEWADVVEVMAVVTQPQILVTGLMATNDEPGIALQIAVGTRLNVRIAARGRDSHPDEGVSDPCEEYCIQVFSCNTNRRSDTPIVRKATSKVAASRRLAHYMKSN